MREATLSALAHTEITGAENLICNLKPQITII
jgi:hypothetical protein